MFNHKQTFPSLSDLDEKERRQYDMLRNKVHELISAAKSFDRRQECENRVTDCDSLYDQLLQPELLRLVHGGLSNSHLLDRRSVVNRLCSKCAF